jgi:hypothetical protein
LPGGPILHGAHARAEHAYRDWKWAVDDLWEDERHCLQTAARQHHLKEETAHKCQEANRHQRLLDKRAAYKRQEAVHCQRLLDEETAHHQRLLDEEAARCLMAKRAALKQQMVAAQTIFLWLCRRRLHIRLAHQTSQRQQHKAALTRLQYKQDCCSALVEEQQRQAAAAQAMALADEADKRRRQDALATEQRRQESAERTAVTAENALAADQRRRELAKRAAETAEKALATEQRRRELAKRAAATTEKALAKEQCLSLLAKMAFTEYNAQTIVSWNAAAVEVAAFGAMVLTELKAAPKLSYGGPPPTHFPPPFTAKEVAELNAATLDNQRQATTQEKTLADKANKRRQAAALEKALADDANKQCRSAMQEKALADKANKQRRAAARDKALADEANKQRRHELAKRAMTLAKKALAKDEHNENNDNVARQFEAYAGPLFACVDVSWPKSEPWMTGLAIGLHLVTRSLPRRTTKPQLQRCCPRHPQRPCRQPPTTLLRIRTRYLLPWGGAFM